MASGQELLKIEIRPAAGDDDGFLFRIYAETRADEFAVLGWDTAQLDAFLRMQFMMRRRSYAMQLPGAETFIAEAEGRPAGAFITDHRPDAIELVDIAVSREARRCGIAGRIIGTLMDEGLPIDLSVEVSNDPAIRLYEKLGFRETALGDVYRTMRWTPSSER